MLDMFRTMILPAAVRTQNDFAKAISQVRTATGKKKGLTTQVQSLETLSMAIETAIKLADQLEKARNTASKIKDLPKQADSFSKKILDQADKFRVAVDELETMTDDKYWSMPKYRELLFLK